MLQAGVIKPIIDDGENIKKIDIDDVIQELQKIL